MQECIFCKIINKEIKSEIVYEDDKFIAFKDINPQAPIHVLVVPKKHLENISVVTEESEKILQGIFCVVKKVAEKLDILKDGYRIVINNGKNAGQEVQHLHFHILGGRKLGWPPG